ncbi:anthranilate 1,2-dioxygenase system ferredoxin--NAD(+) reductase [Paraburkholderia sp.]|uniref:anthranilate 1,2-dioxygenase system ferredoxin--NAD(+) reductase n=1 Tax=Paraburkholderia sp. TaxID=1926495 RepID=UPI002392D64A|nr:anthranilate 1,2-dioxygenase system ferredoxin--NAD(+) reductase [Paraburkholderia sp.]MDE1180483.1 FAD-dependent oxidoreductase [Paraburkholderia sp.]
MSSKPFVIVGAGHAARRAAESLRERDADVRIVMIGAEPELPYDRPVLSKDALMNHDGEHRAFIRDAAYYDAQRIELRLGVSVVSIDRAQQVVQLDDGSTLGYARLLLATGSRVRRFTGPVDDGVTLHYVRTVADARALRAALAPGKRVVVLGGGFIGLEVAASAATLGCTAVVIEPAAALLQRAMPRAIGEFILAMHASKGVDVQLNTKPLGIRRRASGDGECAIVETDRGEIDADVVVIGIGVVPNVELAMEAGLDIDNGIVVDAQCRTSDPAIFAAGEVTQHFNPLLARQVRIESWQVAENQPAIAAANMLGDAQTYAEIPWLWSDQFDCNLQTLGVFTDTQTLVTRGVPGDGTFTLMALGESGELQAVAAVNAGRDIGACKRLMAAGKVLDAASLANPAITLRSML